MRKDFDRNYIEKELKKIDRKMEDDCEVSLVEDGKIVKNTGK